MEFFARPEGIFNEQGNRIRLKAVNWFGFETNINTIHGLWATSLDYLFSFLEKTSSMQLDFRLL